MTWKSNLTLVAGAALLVIWYLTGGPPQLQWWWAVHKTAGGGWNISQAYNDETMKPRFWLPVCLFSGTLLLLAGVAVKIRHIFQTSKDTRHG
jgi:hypothetical protein